MEQHDVLIEKPVTKINFYFIEKINAVSLLFEDRGN